MANQSSIIESPIKSKNDQNHRTFIENKTCMKKAGRVA